MFSTYLQLGFDHILDLNGYDHILFIVALCAVYTAGQWKNILILVTAFTIGHSLTLALSALDIVVFRAEVIEFLIPLTILLTALFNVYKKDYKSHQVNINYALALFFGLIHGLGFSNYFKALLGREESIIAPLLAFNIGVELGQIVIVLITVLLGYFFATMLKTPQREWNLFVSGAAAGVAFILLIDAKFW